MERTPPPPRRSERLQKYLYEPPQKIAMENQDKANAQGTPDTQQVPVPANNSVSIKEHKLALNAANEQTGSVADAATASVSATENILRAMQNQILELSRQLKDMHSKVGNIPQFLAPKMSTSSQLPPDASLSVSTTTENGKNTSFISAPMSASTTTLANAQRLHTMSYPYHHQSGSVSGILTQPTSTSQSFSLPSTNYGHFNNLMPSNTGLTQTPNISTNTPNFSLNMPQQNVANYAFLPQALPLRKVQDLPPFSGQPEDWPIFYTAFLQSTSSYNYTNLENNQRLQKSLTGEARESVKSLLIHPDNVFAIIEQLRFRFGRPEQLIRSQLNQVREIAPISETALSRLVPFATKVKNLAVFLQTVNGQQHVIGRACLEASNDQKTRLGQECYTITAIPDNNTFQ